MKVGSCFPDAPDLAPDHVLAPDLLRAQTAGSSAGGIAAVGFIAEQPLGGIDLFPDPATVLTFYNLLATFLLLSFKKEQKSFMVSTPALFGAFGLLSCQLKVT